MPIRPGGRPGQVVPRSGIYGAGGRETTLRRGVRFPPCPPGLTWEPVRVTGAEQHRQPPAG
jgi:hypothetical protein